MEVYGMAGFIGIIAWKMKKGREQKQKEAFCVDSVPAVS